MSYTLVIVDMQNEFRAANGKTIIANCKREIKRAMKDNAAIIFLEYYGNGPTKSVLSNLVDGYEWTWTETKDEDDGSLEVAVLIRKYDLDKKLIKVCGVNTDCCVKATVSGLTARFLNSSIEVIADACASDWYHESGLNLLRKIPNVNVRA